MRLFALVFLTLPVFATAVPASAQDLLACQSHYEARKEIARAKAASDCYSRILASRPADPFTSKAALEGMFLSSAWVYERASDPADRLPMLIRGLETSARLIESDPYSPLGHYWNAVFLVLNCKTANDAHEKKRGPSCVVTMSGLVTDRLMRAMDLDPRIDGYGPHRLFGVLLRELPADAGGDLSVSEKFLREGLRHDPSFSSNYVEYARTLLALHRSFDARRVLDDLLEHDCMTMNPFRAIECREDQLEAERLLGRMPGRR